MTRLTFLLPLAALSLCSCDTPYFAFMPEKAAKNRAQVPGDSRGGRPAGYHGNDAYLAEIPPSPASTDRGGSDTPTYATSGTYAPDKKITLEQLTGTAPAKPDAASNTKPAQEPPKTVNVRGEERILEPQPVHWFGRPNEGNTAAIPVGPLEKP